MDNVPAGRAVVVNVATPLVRVAEPRVAFRFFNQTLPVGFLEGAETVAMKVAG